MVSLSSSIPFLDWTLKHILFSAAFLLKSLCSSWKDTLLGVFGLELSILALILLCSIVSAGWLILLLRKVSGSKGRALFDPSGRMRRVKRRPRARGLSRSPTTTTRFGFDDLESDADIEDNLILRWRVVEPFDGGL
ncbi:hypothetical protein BT96DRAFT_148395 [Gymnopus androsaceus JB14]|uniref:Transmembrane protein n=1 Tax=Gymnopus androsaceus JB14 TaxID=1447944 RepID=A0A6A4I5C1_9AGAR|nr:hypothetical protein BT96DRAFT_148395 [Gymnopus androsaceus JB14]